MPGRHIAGFVAVLLAGAGTAVAVAPLESPRTTFQSLELPAPAVKDGVERRTWGLAVRTSGDDVPFPEREPSIFLAARDVDPQTQLVRSVAIVVRNAKASGWLGGPGAKAKVDALKDDALVAAAKLLDDPKAYETGGGDRSVADALAEAVPVSPADSKRRVVAVLALGSEWPALDRALAYSLTESLVKAKAADVVDLDSAERFLGDMGMEPAKDRAADPPLASWAQALGVDAVAAVRATSVRVVVSADDGADLLSAEVLWSRADGSIDRTTTSLRVPHRTYPARGKLRMVLTQADDLSAEMIPRLPPAGTGGSLFASRDMTALGSANSATDTSERDPGAGERDLALVDRELPGAGRGGTASTEDPGLAGPGFRSDSGAARDVPFADARRGGSSESASGVTVGGERGAGGSRNVGGANAGTGATMEPLALSGLGPDGSSGEARGMNGAGGTRGGGMEPLALGANGDRDGGGSRDVNGTNGRGGSAEALALGDPGLRRANDGRDAGGAETNGRANPDSLALVGPGARAKDEAATLADWCALQPKARVLGSGAWLVHHPLNRPQIIPDGDPMLEAIAKELAADRGARVRVVGHTCNVGDTGYNSSLGSRRSDGTRERLIELGVPEARIDSTTKGEDNPVCTNETRVGRMNNRRTEIHIEAGSDRTEER